MLYILLYRIVIQNLLPYFYTNYYNNYYTKYRDFISPETLKREYGIANVDEQYESNFKARALLGPRVEVDGAHSSSNSGSLSSQYHILSIYIYIYNNFRSLNLIIYFIKHTNMYIYIYIQMLCEIQNYYEYIQSIYCRNMVVLFL